MDTRLTECHIKDGISQVVNILKSGRAHPKEVTDLRVLSFECRCIDTVGWNFIKSCSHNENWTMRCIAFDGIQPIIQSCSFKNLRDKIQ